MNSLFLLVPIAIVFTVVAVSALFWAINNKQYDDLDSAGERILFEELARDITPKTGVIEPDLSAQTSVVRPRD